MQGVKIAAEFSNPVKHSEIRVTRKSGDGGGVRSSAALILLIRMVEYERYTPVADIDMINATSK